MAMDEKPVTIVCNYAPRPVRSNGRRFVTIILIALIVVTSYARLWGPSGFFVGCDGCGAEYVMRAHLGVNGSLAQALEMFKFNTGDYPAQLRDLVIAPQSPTAVGRWRGPYLKDLSGLQDPWGHELRYMRIAPSSPTGPFLKAHVWSIGPDGIDQTPDDIHGP